MKEHKLARAVKVLTAARNKVRKVSRMFRSAHRAPSTVEDFYCTQVGENYLPLALHKLDAALTAAGLLLTWADLPNQSDGELKAAMLEAIDTAAPGKPGLTCLPNWWIWCAVKTDEGVCVYLGSFLTSFESQPELTCVRQIPRPMFSLGHVRRRGINSPNSLVDRALRYALDHPDEVKHEE